MSDEAVKKIIALANSYSVGHDLHDEDNRKKLTLIIIQQTLEMAVGGIMKMKEEVRAMKPEPITTYDMDIYGGMIPLGKVPEHLRPTIDLLTTPDNGKEID